MLTVSPAATRPAESVEKWSLLNLWLNTDYFAEVITLRPVAGPDKTITVHIDEATRIEFTEPVTNIEVERLAVLFAKVPLDADDTKGYLNRAIVGMQMLRDTSHDTAQEPYVFAGEIEYERPYWWRLIFERHRQISASPRR